MVWVIFETKGPLAGAGVFFETPQNKPRLTKDEMGVESEESEESYNSPYE